MPSLTVGRSLTDALQGMLFELLIVVLKTGSDPFPIIQGRTGRLSSSGRRHILRVVRSRRRLGDLLFRPRSDREAGLSQGWHRSQAHSKESSADRQPQVSFRREAPSTTS